MPRPSSYWKCKYDELVTFYPRYYQDVFEMDAILRAEGAAADDIDAGVDRVIDNNFIDTADEETLDLLESFLGITLQRQMSTEERRKFIKSYFAGQGKISASRIAEMIYIYTGAEVECEFYPFDEERNNRLDIIFKRGSEANLYISDIYYLLSKMLPAHIEYRAILAYQYGVEVGKRYKAHIKPYAFCGMLPNPVCHIRKADTAIESSSTGAVVSYLFSEDGEPIIKAGEYPKTAAASAAAIGYRPCGTTFVGGR